MPISRFVEYEEASDEVRAVYDDIMATRGIDWVNNFWKAIAPGALDPVVKEMLFVAVSVTNGCDYCINSHTAAARKAGMSDAMLHELLAVVSMANETNAMVTGYQVELDEKLHAAARAE